MTAPTTERLDLDVEGMTCASCANRIERKLNKLDGVHATVNFATERAHVEHPSDVDTAALIEAIRSAGYDAAPVDDGPSAPDDADADPDLDALRTRVLISAALTIPVVVLAMVPAWQFTYWQWLSLTLAAPVVVWGAWPFHRAAWVNLRHGATTMDTLVSMGTLAAFGWSLYALFLGTAGEPGMTHGFDLIPQRGDGGANIYLEAAAGVTTFLLLGRYLEKRATRTAGDALRALMRLGAKDVAVVRDGVEQRIPIAQLAVGDEFVVRPGEKIATDGVVVGGASAVDASMVTGESMPTEVGPGAAVVGATINTSGRLLVRATHVGADTALAQMTRMVADAQAGKAGAQRLADRISAWFVPVVIAITVAALGFWLGAAVASDSPVGFAFTAAVSVLIIACPCALGLATPTALMVGTGRGAQLGILLTGPEVLEQTRRIDTVLLDKTGTVTTGVMQVEKVLPADGVDADRLLAAAAAVESASEHPLAKAIVAAAQHLPIGDVTDFTSTEGVGVSGIVGGEKVRVGSPRELGERLPTTLRRALDAAHERGATAVIIAIDGDGSTEYGVIVVADTVKESSREAISELKRMGLTPVLLTGDNAGAARFVAGAVGIDQVIAEVRPEEKVNAVKDFQRQGKTVAMVGDGINDAAALAQADLGVSMGTGTDVAIAAADLTIVDGDLRKVVDAIALSRRTLRTIKGNLFWAFGYNVAALPIAAAGLLNPMIAGAAMAFSSVFVVANSLRLRGVRPYAW
ncbi:heavy metal translocating P-type ATPase [Gordonia sp. L191]|uniref:heavy metal translocating P-type ATPase n=1 Tax=Gordonia sp. L191 TaxID=2982699 RepID=UPI0024BFD9A0|nr:heavy metal translocating P-type ATPase [Gordonia sp. L191]WHU46525.1 heavy metal translocating P-type ATPase [Gordonia sp. L191]